MQGNAGRHLLEAFLAYPGRALMVFAWTTLGFAALDWARTRVKLTHYLEIRGHCLRSWRRPTLISRTRSISEFLLVSGATIFTGLAMLPWAPAMIFGPAAAFIAPAPVWSTVYPLGVLMAFATLALHATNVAHPVLDADAGISTRGIARGRVCSHAGIFANNRAGGFRTRGDANFSSRISSRCSTRWGQLGMAAATVVGVIELIRALHGVRSRRARLASAANRKQASHFNGA